MTNCQHGNKAYSPMGITLTCNPPVNISNWICKDCGEEGQDRKQEMIFNDYDETKRRFAK